MKQAWTACHELLRSGYGVEDISLRLNCSVEKVRREVKSLRDRGDLIGVLRVPSAAEVGGVNA